MGKNKSLNYPYPILLASTSPYRAGLLKQLELEFETCSPDCDEENYKKMGLAPQELSLRLATLKAESVSKNYAAFCIIASDQVCALNNVIFSKPKTRENAIAQLEQLQGQTHDLFTSVCIIYPQGKFTFSNHTQLTMRELSLEQIQNYVDQDLPLDCAGSYKLETTGVRLFKKIRMDDHTAIIGLPLIELNNILINMGYTL